jgi:transposase-like protein
MEETPLSQPHRFCANQTCADYGAIGRGNIQKYGQTDKGIQRFQCHTCHATFVETRGTVFYGKQHSQQTILECLAMVADRCSLAAIHRIKGIKEETVTRWLQEAAQHVEAIEAVMFANFHLTRAQLDALWTYVGHKGEKGAIQKATSKEVIGAAAS